MAAAPKTFNRLCVGLVAVVTLTGCGDDAGGGSGETGSTGAADTASPGEQTTGNPPVGSDSTAAPGDPTDTGVDATTAVGEETAAADSGSSSGGDDPLAWAGEMNGYRWELPCQDPSQRDTCPWDPALLRGAIDDPNATLHRETLVTFGGDAGTVYDVEIRIRGLSEPKDFTGGEVVADHFQIGGDPGVNDYNIYAIDVGEPAQRYTLNRNAMGVGHYTFVMDYTVTIPIQGGTEVRLTMIDPNNIAIANPGGNLGGADPFVVPEIEPFPDPFFGQFIQMDVLSVTPQN